MQSSVRAIAAALIALASMAAANAGSVESSQTGLGLHLKPCVQGHVKARAMCGTFGVHENRETQSGRIIQLGVIVLKAKHPSGEAIANIEGGPGVPSLTDAPYVADGDFPVLKPFLDAGTFYGRTAEWASRIRRSATSRHTPTCRAYYAQMAEPNQ